MCLYNLFNIISELVRYVRPGLRINPAIVLSYPYGSCVTIQATVLTPLPGTRLFERYLQEGRLLYTDFPEDWDHYDMTEVSHHHSSMEPDVLAGVTDTVSRQIYAWPALIRKAVRTFYQTRNMTATKFAWGYNIAYRNVVVGQRKLRKQGVCR